MPKQNGVSRSVIKRLPRYYRFLGELLTKGEVRISSRELAERMQLTASQIRQDLNCFGGFGQQGYGYHVEGLYKEIGRILGLNTEKCMLLVGAGNLGRTVARHMNFEACGFRLIGIFDNNPSIIGQTIAGLRVRDVEEIDSFCVSEKPCAAVLCIPYEAACDTAERLINNGVSSFWNFSHYDITLKFPQTIVENVHLGDSLMTFCYRTNAAFKAEQDNDGQTPDAADE